MKEKGQLSNFLFFVYGSLIQLLFLRLVALLGSVSASFRVALNITRGVNTPPNRKTSKSTRYESTNDLPGSLFGRSLTGLNYSSSAGSMDCSRPF
jgi:hypothetical protein